MRIGGGQLRAIFIPRRRGAASPEFTPARQSDAFRALLPTTAYELPGWPDVIADKVARIAGLAPGVLRRHRHSSDWRFPSAFVASSRTALTEQGQADMQVSVVIAAFNAEAYHYRGDRERARSDDLARRGRRHR
ncbi:MAG: hypothetical protein QM811_21140 [Pirellulales bacterium]